MIYVMEFVTWLIFGLIVGLIANAFDTAPSRGGLLGTVILGITGAVVGGFLANIVFGISITGFSFLSLMVAVLGAVSLLVIGRASRRV